MRIYTIDDCLYMDTEPQEWVDLGDYRVVNKDETGNVEISTKLFDINIDKEGRVKIAHKRWENAWYHFNDEQLPNCGDFKDNPPRGEEKK